MSNIERAPQAIVEMSESSRATIKEREFVTKWLLSLRDYIAGDEVAIALWLQENDITAFSEVDVVDNDGEVLFSVPSILMRQDKLLPDGVASDIGDIMHRADNMNRVMPGRGNDFIRNEITNKIKGPQTLSLYQSRWDSIFTRYDLEPVFSNTSTINSTPIETGDFDGYEEL